MSLWLIPICKFAVALGWVTVIFDPSLIMRLYSFKLFQTIIISAVSIQGIANKINDNYDGGVRLVYLYRDRIENANIKSLPVPKAVGMDCFGRLKIYFKEPYIRYWFAPIFYPLPYTIHKLDGWVSVEERLEEAKIGFANTTDSMGFEKYPYLGLLIRPIIR